MGTQVKLPPLGQDACMLKETTSTGKDIACQARSHSEHQRKPVARGESGEPGGMGEKGRGCVTKWKVFEITAHTHTHTHR